MLTEINDTPIRNVAEMQDVTDKNHHREIQTRPDTPRLSPKTEQLLTVVRVGIKELEDPGLEAQKAWLPVAAQAITSDLAAQLGSPGLHGVRLTQVYADSTAKKPD